MALKVFVLIIGGLFLVIGFAGIFTPENFASNLGLAFANLEGAGTVRAMIGAHYVAMGGVCIYAITRGISILLLPIGVIEVVMVIARGITVINGEFGIATLAPTIIEVSAAIILLTAAKKLSSAK